MSDEIEKEAAVRRGHEEDLDTAEWFKDKGGFTGQLARAYLALKAENERLIHDFNSLLADGARLEREKDDIYKRFVQGNEDAMRIIAENERLKKELSAANECLKQFEEAAEK